MSLRINGYSERGMVNAVCEDIMHAANVEQLATFLSWCRFPFQPEGSPNFGDLTAAHILVEQSFSDFGDLDLLFLLDHADRKQSVLIEAKVATDTPSSKRIDDQWADFRSFLQGAADQTSSLFVQLYRKLRLIERVADLNRPFELHPLWGRQSLGANRVILKAARLLADYREQPWYVALVPDESRDVDRFFSSTLREFRPDLQQLPGWNVERMGYLTWPEVHDHVREATAKAHWQRTLSAFEWNEHQIYQRRPVVVGEIAVGTVALWNDQRIVVVGTGRWCHRAILEMTDATRFPRSFLVSVDELTPLTEARVEIAVHQPERGAVYNWNHPATDQIQPPDRAPVPTPPQLVKVKQSGWETTRVIRANGARLEEGGEFHVFNHHLRRETR